MKPWCDICLRFAASMLSFMRRYIFIMIVFRSLQIIERTDISFVNLSCRTSRLLLTGWKALVRNVFEDVFLERFRKLYSLPE